MPYGYKLKKENNIAQKLSIEHSLTKKVQNIPNNFNTYIQIKEKYWMKFRT